MGQCDLMWCFADQLKVLLETRQPRYIWNLFLEHETKGNAYILGY